MHLFTVCICLQFSHDNLLSSWVLLIINIQRKYTSSQLKMESRCPRFLMFLKKITFFLWAVKSLVLVPWDIYTDVNLAITHCNNGHMVWGGLTVTFLLPSLMLPYHYFHIIKFAVDMLKFLFKASSPSYREHDFIYARKRWITNLDAILVYFEDIPQFILQVCILWKTPVKCFSMDGDMTSDELREASKKKKLHILRQCLKDGGEGVKPNLIEK